MLVPRARFVYCLIPGLPGARQALCQRHGISPERKRPAGPVDSSADRGSSEDRFPHCVSNGRVNCKLKLEGLPLASELSPSPSHLGQSSRSGSGAACR